MTAVGFVGLGAMGLPMARNLVGRGFAVRGFDARAAAGEALAAIGGEHAPSAAAAARGADALVIMVVSAAQAEAVLFDDGALDALAPDGIVLLTATCPPKAVETIAGQVLAAGRRFVDAPVSGGVAGAVDGTLTVMAAAPRATLEAARALLDAVGGKVVHVGESPGQGTAAKVVNQLLCGVHLAVAAEAFSLASRVGVDPAVMLDILGGSSASSWMLRDRGPRMLGDGPEITSTVEIFVKDLGIVLEAGRDSRAALPLAAVAHQLFLATSGRGDGGLDDSQVIRTYRALNGGDGRG